MLLPHNSLPGHLISVQCQDIGQLVHCQKCKVHPGGADIYIECMCHIIHRIVNII